MRPRVALQARSDRRVAGARTSTTIWEQARLRRANSARGKGSIGDLFSPAAGGCPQSFGIRRPSVRPVTRLGAIERAGRSGAPLDLGARPGVRPFPAWEPARQAGPARPQGSSVGAGHGSTAGKDAPSQETVALGDLRGRF